MFAVNRPELELNLFQDARELMPQKGIRVRGNPPPTTPAIVILLFLQEIKSPGQHAGYSGPG